VNTRRSRTQISSIFAYRGRRVTYKTIPARYRGQVRTAGALLLTLLMTALLGCSQSPSNSGAFTPSTPPGFSVPPTSVTTAGSAVKDLPSGVYVDGRPGTPHYFISLTTNSDGTLTGTVSFLYQDGHTFQVFAFTGTTQSGTVTLDLGTTHGAVPGTYGNQTLTLTDCLTYLGLVQQVENCTFKYQSTGVQ
jgi:hypothetical protein